MDCQVLEDRLSDYVEDTLDPLTATEVTHHLGSCVRCRNLLDALREVTESLRESESVEPPEGLADRVARASWERGARGRLRAQRGRERWWVWGLRLAAAVLFLATGAIIVITRPQVAEAEADVSQLSTRVVNTGIYLSERGERLVEDLRMLQLIARTAFEGRLDQMSERVDDYRKMIERRREDEDKGKDKDKQSEESRTPLAYRT